MPDWSKSMQQTFEYYTVNPRSWQDDTKLTSVIKCTINRDNDSDTLGSATFEVTENLGECYIRVYLVTNQNGVIERFPLGTFLVQTPSTSFDGKTKKYSLDAYTPLLELNENPPPLGYSINKKENIMDNAYQIVREHVRAPVVKVASGSNEGDLLYSDFVSNTDDTWLTYVSDLIANAKYKFDLDELSRILFVPNQDITALQPKATFSDDDSSILYSDVTMDHDLYGIPNVVEVVYSASREIYTARVVNDDENSPTSTVNRGREIIHRVTDPDWTGEPTKRQLQRYAENLLKQLSSVEYTVSYSHGYYPVRVNDCVRLNYTRAGINNVKAKIISQSIECSSGCKVTEKAVFTTKLWR